VTEVAPESERVASVDPLHFAGFLRATGHRVYDEAGAHWYDAAPAFLLGVPSHRLLRPSSGELRRLFRHQPCLGLRFSGPVEGPGRLSYQIVCDRSDYGIDQLSANTRSKVRRGLRRCAVGPIAASEVAAEGQQADVDTVARQGRGRRLAGERWERFWRAAGETEGIEVWGARAGGVLAAFLLTVCLDDRVEFLLARSRSDCLDAYPNNALIFTVTEEMLARRGLRQITFGLEALEEVDALEEFKYGMGFRRELLRQRVVFHPLVRALLRMSPVVRAIEGRAEAPGRAGAFWRKTAGLVRFAREGGDLGRQVGS
jgi:hypothetical protein